MCFMQAARLDRRLKSETTVNEEAQSVCVVGSTPTFSSCTLCQRVCARCMNNVVVLLDNNEWLYPIFEYINNLKRIVTSLTSRGGFG
jgi:hypothetical protein